MKVTANQKRMARALRKELLREVNSYGDCGGSYVAVPLSGGVDSHCALFSCLEAGLKPHIFSVHLEGVNSRDIRAAQATAEEFSLPITIVTLPSDLDILKNDIIGMAQFGCTSKTDFECFWIMWYMLPAIKAAGCKVLYTGHGADSLYCLSRRANQHFKYNPDDFRREAFSSTRAFQNGLTHKWCGQNGLTYCPVFFNDRVLKIFLGSTYENNNRPIQKVISRLAFKEYFDRVRVFVHQPAQLGDSGIKPHFERLLESDMNPDGRYKSVVGIYNEAVREYAPRFVICRTTKDILAGPSSEDELLEQDAPEGSFLSEVLPSGRLRRRYVRKQGLVSGEWVRFGNG